MLFFGGSDGFGHLLSPAGIQLSTYSYLSSLLGIVEQWECQAMQIGLRSFGLKMPQGLEQGLHTDCIRDCKIHG